MNRAIVHIGPMKSGTSALARYLTVAQSRGLLPPRVIYPIGELWFGRTSNIVKQELELLCIGKLGRSDIPDEQFTGAYRDIDDALASVGEATRRAGDATAIFVCESAGKNTSVEALESWFAPYFDRVTFVSLARLQEFAMPSIIAQRVKAWDSKETNLDVAHYLDHETGFVRSIDYAGMADRWSRSDEPLALIPYVEGEQGSMASIERFFSMFSLGAPVPVAAVQGRRIHPTFSRAGLEELAALKIRARRYAWVPGYVTRAGAKFNSVWTAYHTAAMANGIEPDGRMFSPYVLTGDDVRLVRDWFDDSNRRLLRTVDRSGLEADWEQWERMLGAPIE